MSGKEAEAHNPEIPKQIWVDPNFLTVHFEDNGSRTKYVAVKKKIHPYYKTGSDVEAMRRLSEEGLTQKEIAKKLGIDARTVRKFVGTVYRKTQAQ
jgi:DNA-binding NarL/FixJ family response regulator